MTSLEEQALAKEHGFEAKPDAYRGEDWCKFANGPVRIWKAASTRRNRVMWVRARLVRGWFRDHRHYCTLKDALTETNAEETMRKEGV